MRGLVSLIFWVVSRGPIGLAIVAALFLGGGYWLQQEQDKREALKAQALLDGPPAAVAINTYDPAQHQTELREVTLRAQPSNEYAYRLTIQNDGADDLAYMVPLVAPDSVSERKVIGVALYSGGGFTFDDIDAELLLSGAVDFGAVGPIVDYNGEATSLGSFRELTEEAFEDEGLVMPANLVVVWPYINGREAEHAPSDVGMFAVFGSVGGLFALGAAAKFAFRRRVRGSGPTAPSDGGMPAHTSAPTFDPVMPVAPAAPAAPAVPLWKQRSMEKNPGDMQPSYRADGHNPIEEVTHAPLAQTHAVSDFEAVQQSLSPDTQSDRALSLQTDRPRPGASYETLTPVKSSFGFRKVLIGIVGAAFAILLGSILLGLLGDVRENDASIAAQGPSQSQVAAEALVDTVVPDADPNRHWTDIDMKPFIEWLTATGLNALAGDTNAQLIIGLIVGVPMLLLLLLRLWMMMPSVGPRRRLYMKLSD